LLGLEVPVVNAETTGVVPGTAPLITGVVSPPKGALTWAAERAFALCGAKAARASKVNAAATTAATTEIFLLLVDSG